jgi:hypothetical protein
MGPSTMIRYGTSYIQAPALDMPFFHAYQLVGIIVVIAINCVVLGHTKYKGLHRVFCNPFSAKPFYGSHWMDLVMLRPPGIEEGGFVVTPDSVWYARASLFSQHLHKPTLGLKHLTVPSC